MPSLLIIWITEESTLSANVWMIPSRRGAFDVLEGMAIVCRDEDKLEEWVSRSLTKLSKGKSLMLGME